MILAVVPILIKGKREIRKKVVMYGTKRLREVALKQVKKFYDRTLASEEHKAYAALKVKYGSTNRTSDWGIIDRPATLPFRGFGLSTKNNKPIIVLALYSALKARGFFRSRSIQKHGIKKAIIELDKLRQEEFAFPPMTDEELGILIDLAEKQQAYFMRHGKYDLTVGTTFLEKHHETKNEDKV
jgi:hypothetical protein